MKPQPSSSAEISQDEAEAAFEQVARDNFAASRRTARAPRAVGFLMLQIVVFSAALFIPQTQGIFQLPPEYLVPWFGVYATASILASIAMHKFGPLSDLHIRLELFEGAMIHVVAGLMIYLAPDVITPYWMFFIMLVFTGAPLYPITRAPLYMTISTVGVLALVYVVSGAYGDAFAVSFLGGTVLFLGWRIGTEQSRFLRVQAEKHILEGRLRQRALDVERRRISRELHDGVGSELTALLWSVRELVDETADPALLESTTRRITEELRTVIWDLSDDPSSWQSFCQRLREVTNNLTKGAPIKAEFCVDGDLPPGLLSVDAAHELLRITQELVHNAVRHASASHLWVTLAAANDALSLEVRDDGGGFVAAQVSERGLANIRRRATSLEASFELASGAKGTTIRVVVPLARLVEA